MRSFTGPGFGYLLIKSELIRVTENLPPSYFALVMATGIVSIASEHMGFNAIAHALAAINIVFYVCLWILTACRILFFRKRFMADMRNHRLGAGYFTIVAATCVIGIDFMVLGQGIGPAAFLLVLGILLWLVLIYAVFTFFTVEAEKPPLQEGINGVWLVSVVSTQSVSALSCMMAPSTPAFRELISFFSLAMFFVGCFLYLVLITLIFYRFMFFRLTAAELTHPYWINMGAVAATTLAGAAIVRHGSDIVFLDRFLPLTAGFTLLFWSVASWWIPLLLLLGAWRFLIRQENLFQYDHRDWGMVFPIGMYTVCTFQLAQTMDLDFLLVIPRLTIYVALAAWSLTFLGLLRAIARRFRPN